MGKRAFDVVAASLGLLLLAPLLVVAAAALLLTQGRPILFRQTRVGRGGRDFRLLKFRSMTVLRGTESGSFDAGNPARITPLGRFLRRTKMDELPQLWNVLKGDMSLVGPRPEVRQWVEAYPCRWEAVLRVRPGITDPASIEFRNEEQLLAAAADPHATYRDVILPQKLTHYERYVSKRSFLGDLRLLAATVAAVILR